MTWNASDPRPQCRGPRPPKPETVAVTLMRHRNEVLKLSRAEYAAAMRINERQVLLIELGELAPPRWVLRMAVALERAQTEAK